jgi:3-keto-L-gulonate-6-phosphate decarboxylase
MTMFTKPLIAISIALAFALAPDAAAQAKNAASWEDDIEVGTSLVCDTQVQVERIVTLLHGGTASALAAVNAEAHDPAACAEVSVAFVRGARLATMRTASSAFTIVEILVVGAATGSGLRAVTPNVYVALFEIDERVT